jgi:hypothetical protein
MASTYYMPQSLNAFETWAVTFNNEVTTAPTTYGLTVGDAAACVAALTAFQTAKAISDVPATRTPVTVATTRTEFNNCRRVIQGLVQKYQASGLATPTLSATLGVTDRDTTKTPIPAPTAIPDLGIEKIEPQSVTLRIKELGVLGNALPLNCIGYEVYMSVGLTNPPNSPTDMTFVQNGSRRFTSINFDAADIGKNVSFAVRYRTAKNLVGPWSSIITCTVSAG